MKRTFLSDFNSVEGARVYFIRVFASLCDDFLMSSATEEMLMLQSANDEQYEGRRT